jgi:hypothetical protein
MIFCFDEKKKEKKKKNSFARSLKGKGNRVLSVVLVVVVVNMVVVLLQVGRVGSRVAEQILDGRQVQRQVRRRRERIERVIVARRGRGGGSWEFHVEDVVRGGGGWWVAMRVAIRGGDAGACGVGCARTAFFSLSKKKKQSKLCFGGRVRNSERSRLSSSRISHSEHEMNIYQNLNLDRRSI